MARLLVIDSNSIMNRAFYANPDFTTSTGLHTGAVYGFMNMLLRIKEDIAPDYIVAAFDRPGKTFRHDEYEDYKAGRKGMPDELAQQFPVIKELLSYFAVDILEIDGFEADDVIGTLSLQAEEDGDEVFVLSGDRDTLQLASKLTKVVITKKGVSQTEIYDYDRFVEVFGITPTQFIDVKGLMGDASDNIKGVKGIGEKTAFKLITEYGSIENLLLNLDSLTQKKVKENLMEYREDAIFSKRLATIVRNAPVDIDLMRFRSQESFDIDNIRRMFSELQFKSLLEKFKGEPVKEEKVAAPAEFLSIDSPSELKALEGKFGKGDLVALSFDIRQSVMLTERDITAIYAASEKGDFAISLSFLMPDEKSVEILKAFLENENIKKVCFNVKDAYTTLRKHGIEMQGVVFDANLAAYLLDPADGKLSLKDLALKNMEEFTTAEGTEGRINETRGLLSLYEKLGSKIEESGLKELLFDVEMPLTYILSDMEIEGFRVDAKMLDNLGERFRKDIAGMEKEIFELAGETFNIASPKQLGVILFEKLDLPATKKTKTGYSTNAEVLESLKDKHPIISKIMLYRQLTKIYSTYIEGLKAAIDSDGKIHSNFNQTLATTGRLSSTEPNLQNIPIRTEMGREIRKVFIPEKEGDLLVSADYSQIELRVLAHIAGDENMIEAFNNDIDIHRKTASEVFNVPLDEVTPIQRSNAKAVNFGIVYGISDFSLSGDLGITRKEAGEYIRIYFERYPNVKKYLEDIVEVAKQNRYVTTIMNRKRYIPEVNDRNKIVQAAGVRLAMNSPIQGSAADIIKVAMVKVYDALKERKLKSKLILQVHDELILNVPAEELDEVQKLVTSEMEHALDLKVELKAEGSYGSTWYDA
ncbi:DNA polymerase I [Youngiibacter multivorans]|uniref:DNA polymerase I n=1 Tax=Youngiibacter multivorans TaxID=937251 RepID=A0ABS4G1L9_9CLOT|nr:DNA polymerase I [Youngiibacter multivorans]MBP1918392.1 DNA polymerase-1 [Youngiibacter multivorans]